MKTIRTAGFVLVLCITALFFAFETNVWAMPEDASCYIRLSIKETNVYTEDSVMLQARLQVQRSSRKPLDLPYSIKVYRYDLNNITEYNKEEKQSEKIFREFKGNVSFRFRENTWETQVVEHLLKELPSEAVS